MFEISNADKAGLAVGCVIGFLFVVAVNVYRYAIPSATSRVYKCLSRFLLLIFSIIIISVIRSPATYTPCFFGWSSIGAVDSACDFGIAMGSVGAVVAISSLLLCALAPFEQASHVLDFILSVLCVPVWLALGIYLAVLVQQRKDRCHTAICDGEAGYPRAIAAVVFSFLSFLGWFLALPDAYRLATLSKETSPLKNPVVSIPWSVCRILIQIALAAIVRVQECLQYVPF